MFKYSFFGILFMIGGIALTQAQSYPNLKINTLVSQKISIRAIEIDGDKIWYAGDHNQVGYYNNKTHKNKEILIQSDSLKLEFRSLAQNTNSIFVANIGNPAFIFKINKRNLKVKKVYSETNEKVFYDSMKFWNDKEGITIGDPTASCLSVLITRDGGNSWQKINCNQLPIVEEGEAAFAASNTNICIKGDATWIVSGGKKARVFYSPNKGDSWNAIETPIVQGQAMTGIFTADFYNNQIGIIAGGNYEEPNQNFQNKALSTDGGKSWKLIADASGFGYASCIQFVPDTSGKDIVAIGAMGLYYSIDRGVNWEQVSQDNSLFTIKFLDKHTAFAAGKNKVISIVFN
jgi:photosystem II stability/assembly factor-like uncharacterized protein